MAAPKKLFVCEFITAGGLGAEPFPESLLKQALLMRDTLLQDLADLDAYEMIGMHDARLMPVPWIVHSIAVQDGTFETVFSQLLAEADVVWLIAPETDGVLLRLSELCYAAEVVFIGCGFDATLIGTSKTLTDEALREAHIHTLPTFAADEFIAQDSLLDIKNSEHGLWVAKPEDGAGCEGIRLFDTLPALRHWLEQEHRYLNYLLQPYQTGLAASLSFLCRDGQAWLLSCNQQHIVCDGETLQLCAITVNGMQSYWQRFATIARKIAKMLPDAAGYVGADVIVADDGSIYVLEINPRLTTSYVGLREAIAYNPAKIILDSVLATSFHCPTLQRHTVRIAL